MHSDWVDNATNSFALVDLLMTIGQVEDKALTYEKLSSDQVCLSMDGVGESIAPKVKQATRQKSQPEFK